MIVIVCLDDRGGMMFNNRRQSMDAKLREYVLDKCADKRLWMTEYTYKQFESCERGNIKVSENFLKKAKSSEYCFVEDKKLLPYENDIEKIMIFKWNRTYPFDFSFDIPLNENGWKCTETDEFVGNSHEKITLEVYER